MIDQIIVNYLIGALGTIIGFCLNQMWTSIKDLQNNDINLFKRISEYEIRVSGNYITRDEYRDTTRAFFEKLDRIEDKIDRKVDKL